MRLRSPESLVRDLWDAISDTSSGHPRRRGLLRLTRVRRRSSQPLVSDLADWLADTTDGLAAGARLGLRIEAIPARDDEAPLYAAWAEPDELAQAWRRAVEAPVPAFRLVLELRSPPTLA